MPWSCKGGMIKKLLVARMGKLVIVAKQCPPLPKPILVKLNSK